MTLPSPQSDVENLPNAASETNDDAVEIKRLEADLQRRMLKKLAELCPEEGKADESFDTLLQGYCKLKNAVTAAKKVDLAAANALLRAQREERVANEKSQPKRRPPQRETGLLDYGLTEEEFRAKLIKAAKEAYDVDLSNVYPPGQGPKTNTTGNNSSSTLTPESTNTATLPSGRRPTIESWQPRS